MSNRSLITRAFINALGTTVYIALVVLFMQYAPKFFEEMKGDNNPIAPMIFLMLFVISAAITGALVLGKPVLLYLDGLKVGAVRLFLYTVGFLATILFLTFISIVLITGII